MTVWLMRHPRVQLPRPLCYGRSDVPLDEAHVRQCAEALAQSLPPRTRIVTSERERTRCVARQLGALRPDLRDWQVDARLNEMDFGQWEMVAWADIPQAAVDAWVADFAQHRFGGVESVQDVLERARQVLQGHRQKMLGAAENTLWITHAGMIRALQFWQQHPKGRIQSAQDWPQTVPEFGAVQVYASDFLYQAAR